MIPNNPDSLTNIEKIEKEAGIIKQEQKHITEELNELGIDEANLLRKDKELIEKLKGLLPKARMQSKQLKDALSKTSGKKKAEIVNKFKPGIDKLKKEANILSMKHNKLWNKDYEEYQKKYKWLGEKLRKSRERLVRFNAEIMGRN